MKKNYFLTLVSIGIFIRIITSAGAAPVILFEDNFGRAAYDPIEDTRLINNGPPSQQSSTYDAIVGKWRLSDTGAPSEEQNGYITAEGYAGDSPSGRALRFETRFDPEVPAVYHQMNYLATFDGTAPGEDLRITFAFMLPNTSVPAAFYVNQGSGSGPWANEIFDFKIVNKSSTFGGVSLTNNAWYALQVDISVSTAKYIVTIFDEDHIQLGTSAAPIDFLNPLTGNINRFQVHLNNGALGGIDQIVYLDDLKVQAIPEPSTLYLMESIIFAGFFLLMYRRKHG